MGEEMTDDTTGYPEHDLNGNVLPGTEDEGYCGLAPLETGPNDPWWKIACQPHDMAVDKLIATGQGSDVWNFPDFY